MRTFSRITEISFKNFKNVEYGKVSNLEFDVGKPSLLGIYGQNGSGKTALVEACDLLKNLMSGIRISDEFVQSISVGKDFSEFSFSFVFLNVIENITAPIYIDYSFKLGKQEKLSEENLERSCQPKIFDEVIKVSCDAISKFARKTILVDTSKNDNYCPSYLIKECDGSVPNVLDELKKEKYLAQNSSCSSIFNERITKIFAQSTNVFFKHMLSNLKMFALAKLFVVTTKEQNLHDFGLLSSTFGIEEQTNDDSVLYTRAGKLFLPLKSVIQIPIAQAEVIHKAVLCLNSVLEKVIPGLRIEFQEKGRSTDNKGQEVCNFEVLSNRNGIKVPLETESNGIKKLISILQVIIAVYNRSDITVLIDDFDVGIFEYLLGELLSVIADNGKGQLIFTAHNLRPLELLDKKYLCFTTANPKNRYVRMHGVKSNNNLRDFYYRDIQLGIQDDDLYESTDKSQIALCLHKAGHPDLK